MNESPNGEESLSKLLSPDLDPDLDHLRGGPKLEHGASWAKTINVFRACLGAQLTICAQK